MPKCLEVYKVCYSSACNWLVNTMQDMWPPVHRAIELQHLLRLMFGAFLVLLCKNQLCQDGPVPRDK